MSTFHRILFPVDFSVRCADTAPYVAWLAREFGSEVLLLNVLYDPSGFGGVSSAVAHGFPREGLILEHEAELEDFERAALAGLPVSRIVEFGEPAECIARVSMDRQIDLIVMPTHGRGRFRRLLLGSVTSKALHDVRCAVWTTAHSESLSNELNHPIQSIVCAIDMSAESIRILDAARDLAQRFEAELRIVHAIAYVDLQLNGVIENAPFQSFLLETAYDWIEDLQRANQTNYKADVKYGSVGTVVHAAAVEADAQLVVVGRGRLTELFGRLRTNVSAIIRESPCPVLSV